MLAYKETAIVRRLAELNVQNFLYMQVELSRLEDRLKEKEQGNCFSRDDRRRCLREGLACIEQTPTQQMGVMKANGGCFRGIREKLKEYSASAKRANLV